MAATATSATCALGPRALGLERRRAAVAPHCVGLPTLPSPQPAARQSLNNRLKTARNVVVMSTGDAPAEVSTEVPEIVKTLQDVWDKIDDKYAVTSLAFAAIIALWGSTGLISAIDRLPLVPGVLELVGIGYTGWFAYRNLVFKPDREALIAKVKGTYGDITGSS